MLLHYSLKIITVMEVAHFSKIFYHTKFWCHCIKCSKCHSHLTSSNGYHVGVIDGFNLRRKTEGWLLVAGCLYHVSLKPSERTTDRREGTMTQTFKVKVKVILRLTVSQPVSLGVKPHLGPTTRYLLLCDSYGLVLVGCPLWREDGSVFFIFCGPLPGQSFSGPSPLGLETIFYCLRIETSLFVASYERQPTYFVMYSKYCSVQSRYYATTAPFLGNGTVNTFPQQRIDGQQ
jgi:hypothetical protein